MLDYRQRLIESAKPGWGPFYSYNEVMETEYKDLLDDPNAISECDTFEKAFLFDYFIAIPLSEFARCRSDYISPGFVSTQIKEITTFLQDGSFTEEELRFLPDLFHDYLKPSDDMTKDEKDFIKTFRKATKDIFKKLFSPGDIDEETLSTIFTRIADVGCKQALHCFALRADDRYKEFEWEIVEGVLRSPYFPDFYDKCENAAMSPDGQFDWDSYVKDSLSNQEAVSESQPTTQTEDQEPKGEGVPKEQLPNAQPGFGPQEKHQTISEQGRGQIENNPSEEELNSNSALVLPTDYFLNDSYIDEDIHTIGNLSDWVRNAPASQFAQMINYMAGEDHRYIDPSLGNRRLLASILSGRRLNTNRSTVQWIEIMDRKVSKTEKVMLWLCQFLYGGGYADAYMVLGMKRTIAAGDETAYTNYADKKLQKRIESLYPERTPHRYKGQKEPKKK